MLIIFCCTDNHLPYGLEIRKIETEYRIQEASKGVSVLEENYNIAFKDSNPKIRYIKRYCINKLGLVVFVLAQNGKNYYVAIKPIEKQEYWETSFNYSIYDKGEYEKLNLKDRWYKVRK
jgi:hypothetical protein